MSLLMPDPTKHGFKDLESLYKVIGWREKMLTDPDFMPMMWPVAGNHRCAARLQIFKDNPGLYRDLRGVNTTPFNLIVGLGPAMAKEAGRGNNDTARQQAANTVLDKFLVSFVPKQNCSY
jgi:hypothetical protein